MKPYYQDSAVTIYHGDCLKILPELEPVDHVITDPPYARDVYRRLQSPNTHPGSGTPARMGYKSILDGKTGKAQGRGIRNHQYSSCSIEKLAAGAIGVVDEMIEPVSIQIARILKRWGIVFSDAESTHRWKAALEIKLRYIRTGVWVKPDPMPQFSGDRPAVGFEPCTIVHAQGPMRWNGGGHAAVWTHNTCKGNLSVRPDHPCPKPEPLMRELVQDFTDSGETILDPFMGSGTTLRAAKDLGRKAIGIEIEEKYCEIAAKRMAQEVLAL